MLALASRELATKTSVLSFRMITKIFVDTHKNKIMDSPAKTQDFSTSDRPETPTQVYAFG